MDKDLEKRENVKLDLEKNQDDYKKIIESLYNWIETWGKW